MINANGGSIVYTVKVDASGAVTGIKQAEGKMVSASESAGTKSGGRLSKAWAVATGAIAGVASQVFSKVSSVISQNLSAGIARADVLNNYVNVMSNLGIGADAAKKSVESLSDGLDGLPTALDTASLAVQRLTSVNGNIEKSTDQFLAFNNAVLAGGTSAEIQSNAIEQMMQAYSKGKPDMMEWRAMMQAMPAQLSQVAQAMGYGNADSLGEALRNGTVSMDEFLGKVTELNEEGTGEFLSFADQAKNATGGIQTQLANLSTALTRVITNALNGEDMSKNLDKFVNQFNNIAPRIVEAVIKVGAGIIGAIPKMLPGIIQAIMNTLPAIIEAAKQLIVGLAEALPQIVLMLMEALPGVIEAIGEAIPIIIDAICGMFEDDETLDKLIDAWVNVVIAIAENLPKILEAIAKAIPRIIEALVEFLSDPENIAKLAGAALQLFGGLVTSLFTVIGALISGIAEGMAKLWNAITSRLGQWLDGIRQWAQNVWNSIVQVFSGVVNWIYQRVISPVLGFFSGLWNGIQQGLSGLGRGIQTAFNSIVGFIKAPINAIISAINHVIDGINSIQVPDWVPGIGGASANLGHIPMLANGGIVESTVGGRLIMAGEAGQDEWVVPESKFASLMEEIQSRGGGGSYTINVSGTFATSPDERRKVADQIVEAIEMNNRRRFA